MVFLITTFFRVTLKMLRPIIVLTQSSPKAFQSSCCLDRSVATCLSFALLVAEQLDNATISAHTPLITAIPPAPPATPAPTLADDAQSGKPHSTHTLSLIKDHLFRCVIAPYHGITKTHNCRHNCYNCFLLDV